MRSSRSGYIYSWRRLGINAWIRMRIGSGVGKPELGSQPCYRLTLDADLFFNAAEPSQAVFFLLRLVDTFS